MFVGGRAILLAFAALFLLRIPYAGSAFVLEFLAGFAIARKAWWALPILLIASASDMRVLTYGPAAALILWASVMRDDLFAHLGPLAAVGDASYAIYLTHTIVIGALGGQSALVLILAATGAGIAFHFVVEKPLIRLSRRPRSLEHQPAAVPAEVS
jgi:peptidoglycan/LPS O-acetylase OafA/YrhL